MKKTLVPRVNLDVATPMAPGFLRIVANGKDIGMVPVGSLLDAQLKMVGQRWIEALLKNAQRQRRNKEIL